MDSRTGVQAIIETYDGNLGAILFDLDGTLRHNRPSSLQTFLDYAVQLGAKDGFEKRRRAAYWTHYYWAQSPELAQDVQAYPGLDGHFWVNYALRSLLWFDCSQERAQELAPQMMRYMQAEHQPEDYVSPDVPPTLEVLKQAGFRLGLLSNRDQPCHEHLAQLGLEGYFEMALVAGEVSSWKPDPRIFLHALERLEVSPREAIYIGDNYFADVVGALRAGLQPVLIDPEDVFPDVECPVIHTIGELQELARLRSS